jgi:integrase
MHSLSVEALTSGLSEYTRRNYDQALKLFKEMTGKDLADANVDDVLKFLAKGEEKGWKPTTIQFYSQTVRSILQLIGKNDLEGELRIRLRAMKRRSMPGGGVYISPEDAEKMIKCAKGIRSKAVIAILYHTGIRLNELLSIKVGDVDFKEGSIGLQRRKMRLGYGGKVYFNEDTKKILSEYIRKIGLRKDDFLFPVSRRWVQQLVKIVAKKAGLKDWKKVTPHKLRHSHAITWLFATREGKVDLEAMRRQMGWTPQGMNTMLAVYGDYSDAETKKAYDKVFSRAGPAKER